MLVRHLLSGLLVSAIAMSTASMVYAQTESAPKVEVFGGYSWYRAGGTVNHVDEPDFNKGWAAQFAYNLNHWAGIAFDVAGHYNDQANAHTFTVGPQFKLRTEHITPFAEALVGVQRFDPKHFPNQSATSFLAGGGFDIPVSRRFTIRPFQIDYVNSYYDKLSPTGTSNPFHGFRMQAGLVFAFGLPATEGPVTLACSAEPQAVDAGVPVRISVTPNGFLPKRTLSYSYSSNGGRVAGTTTTASVDTTGVAPGNYIVTAKVVDNGKGKHQQSAVCQADFKINEPPKHPPVLSITANPTSLNAGEPSTITANGSSPDNRPLSYKCSTSAGRLTGSGSTYTLDTTGLPDSTVRVDCTVSDDRNLSVSESASVKVSVPPPPPTAKDFSAIEFMRDTKRPTRVDNQAKGELDRYADALAAAPDSKGVLVGFASSKEQAPKQGRKMSPDFAAQRAVNTKAYLTKEKGIDPARIEVRTGSGEDQKVELWIVPAGATFPSAGTKAVDEAAVKAVPRTAMKAKKPVHRKKQ